MTDRPRTWTLYGWKYCTLSPAEVLGSRVPRGERVRVVEVLDPEAMLAWALRNAGRERVVPIIERAVWKAHQSMLPTDSIAEAVFDALNRGEDT